MTLNEEIHNILISEDTIDSITDGIYMGVLPENYSRDKDAIVFETNIFEAFNTISNDNYGDNYNLVIKCVSNNSEKIYEIGQAVKNYLRTFTSTGIRQIMFNRDVYVFSPDDQVHVLSLDFVLDYMNTYETH